MEFIQDWGETLLRVSTAPTIPPETMWKLLFVFLFLIVVTMIGYMIYLAITKSKQEAPVTDHKVLHTSHVRSSQLETQLTKVGGLDGTKSLYDELLKKVGERERYLVNFCPLTAFVGGYIGPVDKGVFHADLYIRKALRAGVRCFVLPISTYIDDNKRPPLFPFSGKPAIVFRNQNGTITSINGLSVKKFISSLMNNLYQNPGQANEPIMIYLVADQQHLPDPLTQEKEYVQVMRGLAEELKELGNASLKTLGSYGSATGGRREREILTETRIEDLKGKILVATTFDTRLQLKGAYKNITPTLFEACNFLPTYLAGDPEKANAQSNILQNASSSSASKSMKIGDVVGSKVNWVDQTRTILHACLQNDHLVMPTVEQVNEGVSKGVQVIPIPFFYLEDMETVKKIQKTWNGYGWRVKDASARFTKPAPIIPAPANPAMNARAAANLQPGQMVVQ